jgi:GNAT superfamily N-acetyltransferase
VLQKSEFRSLNAAFRVEPITHKNIAIIEHVDKLIEREFPKHGAPLHFLLSTLPVAGAYDPLLEDNLYNNCLQYWAFLDKNSSTCAATCGIFLMQKDHENTLWAGWLVLAPEFRKQGLGKQLIAFVLDFCKEYGNIHGHSTLQFLTSDEPHVQSARNLYALIGSKEARSFPNPYVPGSNAIVMQWPIPREEQEFMPLAS